MGIETIGAALSEPRDAIEDIIEPYLIQRASCSAPRAAASSPGTPSATWASPVPKRDPIAQIAFFADGEH